MIEISKFSQYHRISLIWIYYFIQSLTSEKHANNFLFSFIYSTPFNTSCLLFSFTYSIPHFIPHFLLNIKHTSSQGDNYSERRFTVILADREAHNHKTLIKWFSSKYAPVLLETAVNKLNGQVTSFHLV